MISEKVHFTYWNIALWKKDKKDKKKVMCPRTKMPDFLICFRYSIWVMILKISKKFISGKKRYGNFCGPNSTVPLCKKVQISKNHGLRPNFEGFCKEHKTIWQTKTYEFLQSYKSTNLWKRKKSILRTF